jgi:hypothetical protein
VQAYLKLVSGLLSIAFVLLAASPAQAQTKIWAAITGDFPNGIPDQYYKYGDANEACVSEATIPPSTNCEFNQPGSLRSVLGAQPSQPSACEYRWNCLCGACLIATPEDPRNHNKIGQTARMAHAKPLTCPTGTSEYAVGCYVDSPKGKGPCSDCETQKGNPANLASGNKYQREVVYRAGSGGLELVLFYNSQIGSTYFQKGPFGSRWSSPFFVRARATFQGITVVERPTGRELEFRTPSSGDFFTSPPT